MPAPAIFGVEGRELGPYCVEWLVGPLRACAGCYAFEPDVWVGVWYLDNDRRPELHRTDAGDIEQVARWLESWLRIHVAELAGALGLELRERP